MNLLDFFFRLEIFHSVFAVGTTDNDSFFSFFFEFVHSNCNRFEFQSDHSAWHTENELCTNRNCERSWVCICVRRCWCVSWIDVVAIVPIYLNMPFWWIYFYWCNSFIEWHGTIIHKITWKRRNENKIGWNCRHRWTFAQFGVCVFLNRNDKAINRCTIFSLA